MTEHRGFPDDETAPIAAAFPASSPSDDVVSFTKPLTSPSALPAIAPQVAPAAMPPAGWYPLYGELRYWDGLRWTEHRAPAAVPAYRPVYPTPLIVTDARTNGVEVTIAWILTIVSLGYLLPWAVAATRGKSNSWAVGLLNFLLGWTLIGWLVSLVMACTAHQVATIHHRM